MATETYTGTDTVADLERMGALRELRHAVDHRRTLPARAPKAMAAAADVRIDSAAGRALRLGVATDDIHLALAPLIPLGLL